MMAQYNPGKARQGDDAILRKNWFWQCLGRMESRKPRFKQLAFPKEIGCGLAGGDWPTYKEMILTFARRNRDIRVDIIENYRVDDSESDTSDPSHGPDQDRTPDPDDKDEQDHDEEQEPEDEVEEEEDSGRSHKWSK